jgi:hypothetical protein
VLPARRAAAANKAGWTLALRCLVFASWVRPAAEAIRTARLPAGSLRRRRGVAGLVALIPKLPGLLFADIGNIQCDMRARNGGRSPRGLPAHGTL